MRKFGESKKIKVIANFCCANVISWKILSIALVNYKTRTDEPGYLLSTVAGLGASYYGISAHEYSNTTKKKFFGDTLKYADQQQIRTSPQKYKYIYSFL